MLKGYIEGYYGRFFSFADMSAVLDHMGQLNMDVYLYGPKEDRYHRVDWNKAYPTSEEKNLRSFIRQSNKNSIKPIFAISPGLSLNKYSNKTKISLVNKVAQARKLGFKDFAIFFDDINQERNEALARTHLKVIEDIASLDIVKNPLMICPTVYCKSFAKGEIGDNEYLKVIAENIDPMFPILWTGDEVVSNTISLRSLTDLKKLFDNDIKSWPLYFTPNILPSTTKKVFYISDAFNGFLPTMAQGAGQSIESAHEIFTLLQKNKLDKNNTYFEVRSKRAKIIRKRSNFNFFAFHFSSSIMQKIRNIFLKFLVKRKTFIRGYLGKVYKN